MSTGGLLAVVTLVVAIVLAVLALADVIAGPPVLALLCGLVAVLAATRLIP